MDLDQVFEHIGEFGRYQKWIYLLLSLQACQVAIQTLIIVFLVALPIHRCAIPGLINDTYEVQGDAHQWLIDNHIPNELTKSGLEYQRCNLVSDRPFGGNNSANGTNFLNASTTPCYEWVFGHSEFASTVTEEMGLVCGELVQRSHLPMFHVLGSMVGSVVVGALSDMYGRKPLLCIVIAGQLLFGLITAWVPNFVGLGLCRFCVGFFGVGCFLAAFSLGMELVAPSKRVWTGVVIEIFYTFGEMILAGMAYLIRDWRILQLAVTLPAIIFLSYWWLIPESPRWLLTKGRVKEAQQIIRRAAEVNKVTLPPDLLEWQFQTEDKRKEKLHLLCSGRVMFFRSAVIFFNWCVVSLVYYGLTLNSGYLYGTLHLNFFLSAVMEFLGYCLCIPLLDRLGRRFLHCTSMLVGGVACCCTIFTVLYLDEDKQWITTLLAMVGKLGASAAFAIIFIYSSELFPTVVRSGSVGLGSTFARVGAMAAPYIADLGVLVGGGIGIGLPLIVFGILSIAAGLAALILPETLNKHLPETVQDAINMGRNPQILQKHGATDILLIDASSTSGWPDITDNTKRPMRESSQL